MRYEINVKCKVQNAKLILVSLFFTGAGFSADYVLTKSTFSNAGGSSSSANYTLKDAAGQSVTGESKNADYIEQAGFYTYFTVQYIGVEETEANALIPKVFSLSHPYPNPVHRAIALRYGIPNLSYVTIKVYDVTGREVKRLVDCEKKPGFYNVRWDGKLDQRGRVAQGIYFIRMRASDFSATRKVVILVR